MAFEPSLCFQVINILKALSASTFLAKSKLSIAAWLNPRRLPNFSHISPSSRDRSSNVSSDGTSALIKSVDYNGGEGKIRKRVLQGFGKQNSEQLWPKANCLFGIVQHRIVGLKDCQAWATRHLQQQGTTFPTQKKKKNAWKIFQTHYLFLTSSFAYGPTIILKIEVINNFS